MLVHVYSLKKPVVHTDARSVTLKTTTGDITLLANHRPLIAPLAVGSMRIQASDGSRTSIEYRGGFVEVRPNPASGGEVNVLIG